MPRFLKHPNHWNNHVTPRFSDSRDRTGRRIIVDENTGIRLEDTKENYIKAVGFGIYQNYEEHSEKRNVYIKAQCKFPRDTPAKRRWVAREIGRIIDREKRQTEECKRAQTDREAAHEAEHVPPPRQPFVGNVTLEDMDQWFNVLWVPNYKYGQD